MGFLRSMYSQSELRESGVQLGYRALWRRIKATHKAVVDRCKYTHVY